MRTGTLTAAAICVALSAIGSVGDANAATIMQHTGCGGGGSFGPFGDGQAPWFGDSCDVSFDKFDSSQGNLYRVEVAISGFYDMTFVGHNPTDLPVSFDVFPNRHYFFGITTEDPAFLGRHVVSGVEGWGGGSGTVVASNSTDILYGGFGGPLGYAYDLTGADAVPFIGSGSIILTSGGFYETLMTIGDPAAYWSASLTHEMSFDITYYYSPPRGGGSVPEPQIWAMMVLGFFGLGAGLRAQRRAAFSNREPRKVTAL